MRKIAVTGGIASGKSSVCQFFKELGAYTVSADEISHQLLSPNTNLGKKIVSLLGGDSLTNNQFNRRLIAQKVFSDYSLLEKLENLLHPEVIKEIVKCYETLNKSSLTSPTLFVAEIPLLFESGYEDFFDTTITINAPLEECQRRFSQKTGLSSEDFLNRTKRLFTDEEREEKADIVIINDGTIKNLYKKVEQLYQSFNT